MPTRKRWIVAAVAVFVLALPRESGAYWNWLHELSGPGPFQGPIFWFRCPVEVDQECLLGFVDVPEPRRKPVWFNVEFTVPGLALSGDLENRPDSPSVEWNILEAGLETSKHWNALFPYVENHRWLTLLSGVAGAFYTFSSDGIDTTHEPGIKVRPIGIAAVKRWPAILLGVEYGIDFRYLSVTPEQFGLPAGTFDGQGWVFGQGIKVLLRLERR